MKVLLVAVNAKYIHSNLAVYDLKAYTENIPVEVAQAPAGLPEPQARVPSFPALLPGQAP